jgi:hypothetical protein
MKKYKSILLIIIISLIPLAFTTTIPYIFPKRLSLNTLEIAEHAWGFELPKKYVIRLEGGQQYTIYIDVDTFWDMDLAIKISETPYMITGTEVDVSSYSGETMHFTAPRTRDYYIQIGVNSGSGFFDIGVNTGITSPATGPNVEFFNGTYLLVLILPTVLILVFGLIILLLKARRKSYDYIKKPRTTTSIKRVEKEGVLFCQYCGNKINADLKRCPNCNTPLN